MHEIDFEMKKKENQNKGTVTAIKETDTYNGLGNQMFCKVQGIISSRVDFVADKDAKCY